MSIASPLGFERDSAGLVEQMVRLQEMARARGPDVPEENDALARQLERVKVKRVRRLIGIERVQLARPPQRPYTLDYIERAFTDFIELHGDRGFRDDQAIVGGWARLEGESVMVIGQQKGRDMKEN